MPAPEDILSPRLELSFSLAVGSLILFSVFLPAFAGGMQEFLPSWLFLLLMTVPVQTANIASCVIPAWRYLPGQPLKDVLDLKPPSDQDLSHIIFGTLVVYGVLAVVTGAMAFSLRKMGLDPQEQAAVAIFRSGTPLQLTILVPATVILAPIGEEFCFRYALYKKLEYHFGPLQGVWLTSLIFAAAHLNLQVFPALFLLGLWLTSLYRRTGSLLAPMIAHAMFNGLSVLLIWVIAR